MTSPALLVLHAKALCGTQENPRAYVTATDISPTAVQLFEAAALRAGIAPERVRAFACDSADAGTGESLLSGILTMHSFPQFSTSVHLFMLGTSLTF